MNDDFQNNRKRPIIFILISDLGKSKLVSVWGIIDMNRRYGLVSFTFLESIGCVDVVR